jgi:hypothetical protein
VPLPFGCPLYASSGVGKFSPNSRGNDGVKLRKPSDNIAAIVEPSRQRLPGLSGSGIADPRRVGAYRPTKKARGGSVRIRQPPESEALIRRRGACRRTPGVNILSAQTRPPFPPYSPALPSSQIGAATILKSCDARSIAGEQQNKIKPLSRAGVTLVFADDIHAVNRTSVVAMECRQYLVGEPSGDSGRNDNTIDRFLCEFLSRSLFIRKSPHCDVRLRH